MNYVNSVVQTQTGLCKPGCEGPVRLCWYSHNKAVE